MLEQFALEAGTNILVGILTRIVAALEWFGGRLDDIDSKTQETLSQEVIGAVNTSPPVDFYATNSQRPFAPSFVNIHKNGVFGGAFQHFPQMSKSFFS